MHENLVISSDPLYIKRFRDALATTLSALYGKLLVVMGTAFPMAEVISTYIPPSFYEAYYLYLYIGSMFFLFYMYTVLLRDKRRIKKKDKATNSKFINSFTLPNGAFLFWIHGTVYGTIKLAGKVLRIA